MWLDASSTADSDPALDAALLGVDGVQRLQQLLDEKRPGVFQVGMFAVGGTTGMFSEHLTRGNHVCKQVRPPPAPQPC